MDRPYLKLKAADLNRLANQHWNSIEVLQKIEYELRHFRSSSLSKLILKRVQAQISELNSSERTTTETRRRISQGDINHTQDNQPKSPASNSNADRDASEPIARAWIETDQGVKVRCNQCGAYVLTPELPEHHRRLHRMPLQQGDHSGNGSPVPAHTYEKGRNLQQTLKRFDLKKFRDGQREVILSILDGFDTIVVLPTGTGKSLIYQLAALHRPGVTLVISPLIALMKDQVDKLNKLDIPATFINSTLSASKREKRLQNLMRGRYKIVYIAPERLRQQDFRRKIERIRVGLLAVDEAHCISQWGHDFRPGYLHIADFRRAIGRPPTVALTATATSRVKEEIIRLLKLRDVKRVYRSCDRPNIRFSVEPIDNPSRSNKPKFALIRDILKDWHKGAVIIYTGTRKDAEKTAWFLKKKLNLKAEHYHAGLESFERKKVQEAFINGNLHVVAATNAFGMGIDRPDVRLVIHHTIPGSLEAYYQEAGRAGRDGRRARAILLYNPRDRELQEYFIDQSELRYSELKRLHDELTDWPITGVTDGSVQFNVEELSKRCYFDEEGVKVRVGLQRLEEAGVIEQGWYDGLDRQVVPLAWNARAVERIAKQIKKHCDWKYRQLTRLLAYAKNSRGCRRRDVLHYFGEEPQRSVRKHCCDLCDEKRAIGRFVAQIQRESTAGTASSTKRRPPLEVTILECVREFEGLRTADQMVDLLHGDIRRYSKFRDSEFHGELSGYQRSEIRQAIDRLLAEGKLVTGFVDTLSISHVQNE